MTTAKEVSVDLTGFKDSVEKQFAHLSKLVFFLYPILIGIIGGGFLLHKELGDIKASSAQTGEKVESLKNELVAAKERLRAIETSTSEVAAAHRQVVAAQ